MCQFSNQLNTEAQLSLKHQPTSQPASQSLLMAVEKLMANHFEFIFDPLPSVAVVSVAPFDQSTLDFSFIHIIYLYCFGNEHHQNDFIYRICLSAVGQFVKVEKVKRTNE